MLFKAKFVGRLVNLRLNAANTRLISHNTFFVRRCQSDHLPTIRAASPTTSRKPRKQNLTASEISVLKEKVEENLSVLQSKLTKSVTSFLMK